MTTKTMYQMHIRSWETMEYLPCIYVMADSVDDAFAQMEPFRSLYQAKSAIPEGEWIADEGQDLDDRFAEPIDLDFGLSLSDWASDDGDRGWSDELHENMEFEGAEDYR